MIYLHIGQEKTGTTAIQSFLHHANQNNLFDSSNVIYGSFLDKPNSMPLSLLARGFSVDFLSSPYFKTVDQYNNFRAKVSCRLQELFANADSDTKIIFSSEHFHARLRTAKSIIRLRTILMRAFPGHDIKVVLYIREQASLNTSLHSESVKSTGKSLMPPKPGESEYFDHVLDHLKVITLWAEIFGSDKLILKIYDRDELHENNSIFDFLQLIQLAYNKTDVLKAIDKLNQNTITLSGSALEIKALLNKKFGNKLAPFNQKVNYSLASTFHHISAPSNDTVDTIVRSWYAKDNEVLRQRFFPNRSELFCIKTKPTSDSEIENSSVSTHDIADLIYKLITSINIS